MHEEARRRVARNQALFRETNEAIERGQWPGEPAKVLRLRCECSRRRERTVVDREAAGYSESGSFHRLGAALAFFLWPVF